MHGKRKEREQVWSFAFKKYTFINTLFENLLLNDTFLKRHFRQQQKTLNLARAMYGKRKEQFWSFAFEKHFLEKLTKHWPRAMHGKRKQTEQVWSFAQGKTFGHNLAAIFNCKYMFTPILLKVKVSRLNTKLRKDTHVILKYFRKLMSVLRDLSPCFLLSFLFYKFDALMDLLE